MIYAFSVAAAVLILMFAVAWKREVGGLYRRWRAARRSGGAPSDPLRRGEYFVAAAWTAAFGLFILFTVVLIWRLA